MPVYMGMCYSCLWETEAPLWSLFSPMKEESPALEGGPYRGPKREKLRVTATGVLRACLSSSRPDTLSDSFFM